MRLDLDNVRFYESLDGVSAEFHFPRQIDGRPTLDTDAERVIFYRKASAKNPRSGRPNALSIRVEFEPRTMRAHNRPDL